MQKPNVKLGSLARKREWHILKWLYDNRDTLTLDQGNLLAAFEGIDPTDENGHRYHTTIDDLKAHGLIATDDLDCFYHITRAGKELVRYYQSAEDLL